MTSATFACATAQLYTISNHTQMMLTTQSCFSNLSRFSPTQSEMLIISRHPPARIRHNKVGELARKICVQINVCMLNWMRPEWCTEARLPYRKGVKMRYVWQYPLSLKFSPFLFSVILVFSIRRLPALSLSTSFSENWFFAFGINIGY